MAQRERVVLIDGSWLIFRAFFAIPSSLSTKKGLPTNAIYGFATMFRKLISARYPDRGAVVFDSAEATHREKRFPSYKAHRPPIPEGLVVQIPWIERVVNAHRFPLLREPGFEADDIIATLATQAATEGMDVLVIAGDKDLAQIVVNQTPQGGRIRMQDTMQNVTYDEALVLKKWGIAPACIPDWLALVGDESDNIPGVPGIGKKGASQLLERYGCLENLFAHLHELRPKQREALEKLRDEVFLYREIARLARDVPLLIHLDDLRLPPPDSEALKNLYRELEFASLLNE